MDPACPNCHGSLAELELLRKKMDELIVQLLCVAISRNRIEIIDKHLDHLQDINMTAFFDLTERPTTILREACRFCHPDVVHKLLDRGADPNIPVVTSKPALLLAASHKTGNLEMVQNLLAHGAKISTDNSSGYTALHQACDSDNLDVVKCLVENGADVHVNAKGANWLPIMLAHRTGNTDMVKYLVESGAEIKDCMAEMLDESISSDNLPMMNYLVEQGGVVNIDDFTYYVKSHQDEDTLIAMLDLGIDINEADANDETPIHAACATDDSDIFVIEFLMENNSDIQAISPKYHNTVLHAATEQTTYINCAIIEYILNHNVAVNARNGNNKTAMELLLSGLTSFSDDYDDIDSKEEKIGNRILAIQLLSSAGATVTNEMLVSFKRAALTSEDLSLNQKDQVTELVHSLRQPRSLVQLSCNVIRSSLPTPVNISGLQLSGILPVHICKELSDFSLR